MEYSIQKTAVFLTSPSPLPRLSHSSPPISGFPCQPDTPPPWVLAPAPQPYTLPHSPPAATLLRPHPASLPGFTLSDLCLLQPHVGCSSRCLRVKQGTCLCPHTAEGSLPSLQCLVLPGTGALVQVLINATPTRVNWAAVEAGCAGDSDPENQACS